VSSIVNMRRSWVYRVSAAFLACTLRVLRLLGGDARDLLVAAGDLRPAPPRRCAGDAHEQGEGDQRRRGDPGLVAADELAGAVGEGRGAGGDRLPVEVAHEVVGERLRGGVPPLGGLAHRHQDDIVEVAREALAQTRDLGLAALGDLVGGDGLHLAAVGVPGRGGRDRGAGPAGLFLADDPDGLGVDASLDVVGAVPGQQLVEDHAQRVDIARGRDLLPLHLLGARVLVGHDALIGPRQRRQAQQLGVEQLGDAEIEELGLALAVTRMLDGLRSRWTIRFWCA
jgi:hypothetical protein